MAEIWIYLAISLGFALSVGHKRGFLVGVTSGAAWPFLMGMYWGWKACEYDGQFGEWLVKNKTTRANPHPHQGG